MFDALPLPVSERVACSISAAARYQIPANIVLAVAEKENGRPGQWVRNSNGTHDVGPLQFNTSYLSSLTRYGISPADVASSGCYPYHLAAWRLRQHITKDHGDVWQRAANYHSRTPRYNEIYRYDLKMRAAKWAKWLATRYPTHEVQDSGTSSPRAMVQTRRNNTATASTNAISRKLGPGDIQRYVPRASILTTKP